MDRPPRDSRLEHRSTGRRGKGSLLRLIFGWVLLVIGLILAQFFAIHELVLKQVF